MILLYTGIDVWGDSLLNSSTHAAGTWHTSHNRLAEELAQIATSGGIFTTAIETQIPCINSSSRQRGDMMTRGGGRVPLKPSPHFNRYTRLIMDVQLGHVFATGNHVFKSSSIKDMETHKRGKYTDAYRAIGFAFAPLVANSWGVCGPDLLRFLWAVADHAARNAHSLPLDSILTVSQPGPSAHEPPSETQLLAFKILRGRLNLDYRLRFLTAVYEAITERIFGRTYALVSHPEYQERQAAVRAVWQPACFPPLSGAASPRSTHSSDSSVLSSSEGLSRPDVLSNSAPSLRSTEVVLGVTRASLPGPSYAAALSQGCIPPNLP